MSDRYLILLGLACLAAVSMGGQTPAASTKAAGVANAGIPPRTPWGDPDLQGTWFVATEVPLERQGFMVFLSRVLAVLDQPEAPPPSIGCRWCHPVDGAHAA